MNERQKDEYRRLTGQPDKTEWLGERPDPTSNQYADLPRMLREAKLESGEALRTLRRLAAEEIERLQADNERLMHHVRASPSLSNYYVNLAETEIDAQRRRANTLQDELRALKSSAHETAGDDARDAVRYRWMRDWYHREGKRAEIDPYGHIAVRTLPEWEALLDAAIARSSPLEPTTELSRYRCMFCNRSFATVVVLDSHEETCQQDRAAVKATASLPGCECLVRDKAPSAYHNVKCPRYVADAL